MVTNPTSYMKNYYQNNKDKFRKSALTIVECECGAKVTRHRLTEHKKTNKHNKGMEFIKNKIAKPLDDNVASLEKEKNDNDNDNDKKPIINWGSIEVIYKGKKLNIDRAKQLIQSVQKIDN